MMLSETKIFIKQTKQDLKDMAKSIDLSFIKSALSQRHQESKFCNDVPKASLIDFLAYSDFDSCNMIFDNKTTCITSDNCSNAVYHHHK